MIDITTTKERELIIFELGDCKPCYKFYAIRQTNSGRYYFYALCNPDGTDGYCFGWSSSRDKAIEALKKQITSEGLYILNTIFTSK